MDAELAKEPTGRFLRFFIDTPSGVTLSDCEAFHKKIQPLMENVDYDYMEVSSPGADRPLKRPEDFLRMAGERVELRLYKAIDGQKVVSGELVGLQDGEVVILDDRGQERRFAQKALALVKPLIEFDEEDLLEAIPEDDEGEDWT